jgi:class 3 adenylate cyclase
MVVTMDELRASMSDEQREILNTIWRYQMDRDRSIPVITLCDSLGLDIEEVDRVLEPLGGDVVFAAGASQTMRRYQLTFLGYLLAEQGEELEDLLTKYLSYVRLQLRADPELEKINQTAAMDACEFSAEQQEFFLKMFFRTPFHGGGSRTETQPPPNVDEWFPSTDLRKYLHERCLRNYDSQTPVNGGRQTYIQVRQPFSGVSNPAFATFGGATPTFEDSATRFSSQVIQNFHAPVGVVQTGTEAKALVNQSGQTAESSEEPQPIGFIVWCTHILETLIKESEKNAYAWTEGIDEYDLFRILFKIDEIDNFHDSTQRHGTLDALKELAKLGFLEQDSHFSKVTLAGREAIQSLERVWEEICTVKLSSSEEKILEAVNKLGEGKALDCAWLNRVHHPALMDEMGELDLMKMLRPVSEDLDARGFVKREARAGPHLWLTPTYSGLAWQSKRKSLGDPEVGHVLFLDIVGYSKLSLDDQALAIERLERLVKETETFRRAKHDRSLISLATGDGMALVFFGGVTANLDCAIEVSMRLRSDTSLGVRIGLNSGPVYRRLDINTNINVAGGGINIAQRVMDCGDAGHILVSKSTADLLHQLGGWDEQLHDLGEAEVKHGVKVHIHNFYDETVGNASVPTKLATD